MTSTAHSSLFSTAATPWHTVHRSLRGLGGVVALLLFVAAIGVALYVGGARGWRLGLALWAFGTGYFWMTVMACLLLVAIDARRLRLPGVERTIVGSVLMHGLIALALPLAIFVPIGGDAATIALVAALAATTGLATPLLPRYFSMVLGMLPALAIGMGHRVHIPFPGQPGFAPLGLSIFGVLLATCAFRWWQLLHADAPAQTGMGSAMVMQYRRSGAMAGSYGVFGSTWKDTSHSGNGASTQRRQHKAAPSVRLDGVGPNAPVLALRVALSEHLAPQTLRSHARHYARLGLPLLLFIPAMAVMQAGQAHGDVLHKVMVGVGINVLGWLGLMGGIGLMVTGSLLPWTRWRRANAELPLLALLPGLGDADVLRRNLLRAALGQPLALHALLLTLVLGTALVMHASPLLLVFITLGQLGFAGVVVASTLAVFGGRPLPGWGMGVLLTIVGLLASASTFIPLFATLGRDALPLGGTSVAALTIAWSATAAALLWLGHRGSHGLQQRPHPFLTE